MYDTGEHVLAAGDLYPDQLVVGSGAGVQFSYGQIVAMGDFYESVDQMLAASPAELNRLKALIQRNTEYYRGDRRDASKNVERRRVGQRHQRPLPRAGRRQLRPLRAGGADRDGTGPAGSTTTAAAGRSCTSGRSPRCSGCVLAHPDSSPFPSGPLATNAFADHFLTDAFASGHLINKEVVIDKFRQRFFSGGSVNCGRTGRSSGRWRTGLQGRSGSSASASSNQPPAALRLRVVPPLHPNIRTAGMFAEVLIQAAEAEPVKIGNLAVKLIHDKLNDDGVEVVNDAGDPAWTAHRRRIDESDLARHHAPRGAAVGGQPQRPGDPGRATSNTGAVPPARVAAHAPADLGWARKVIRAGREVHRPHLRRDGDRPPPT